MKVHDVQPNPVSVVHMATHKIRMNGDLLHQSMGLAQRQQLGHTRYYFAIFTACHQLPYFFLDAGGKWQPRAKGSYVYIYN